MESQNDTRDRHLAQLVKQKMVLGEIYIFWGTISAWNSSWTPAFIQTLGLIENTRLSSDNDFYRIS